MPQETQGDLFEIRLTEVGRKYILKSARIVGAVVILSIINSIAVLIQTSNQILTFSFRNDNSYWRGFAIADVLIVLTMVLNIITVFKYYRFLTNLNKSVAKDDEGQFNVSFRHLFSSILFFLAVIVLNLLATMFYIGGSMF